MILEMAYNSTFDYPLEEVMQDDRLAKRVALLAGIPLFAELSAPERTAMTSELRLREYGKDELIFRQGDETKEVYIVLKGKVRIFKTSPGGDETTIAIFARNDIIGEMAAIDGQPRSATGKAIGTVSLLTIAQDRFVYHARNTPNFAFSLAKLLSLKLRWTASYAESVAQFDAAGRLLHILLRDNSRFGEEIVPGKEYVVNLALTQSDLASMVGARREWVNRLLRDWKKRGLLEFERGAIRILDLPRVEAERDSRIEANLGNRDW